MSHVVIKPGHDLSPSGGSYQFDLRDIARDAAGIIDAARLEAMRIVQHATASTQAEHQRVIQAAHRQGFEEGMAKGREAGAAAALEEARRQFADEQSELVTMLIRLIESFKQSRERLYVEARQDVVALALRIASRMLARLAASDESSAALASEACKEALDLIGDATKVVIRAHPADVAVLQRFCETIADGLNAARHIRLVNDAAVGRGGIVLETADSIIDATIPSRIDRIADELVADWRERQSRLGMRESGISDLNSEIAKPTDSARNVRFANPAD